MFRVIILYAPDEETITTIAAVIETAFHNERCVTAVKAAKDALIPDIAGSDIVILGSKAEGKKPIHPDYKEIVRALRGINLAGRIAGIFTFEHDGTVDSFKQVLNDSDITIYEKSLFIESGQWDQAVITEWAQNILLYYKDGT
jgi:flavodoxin